MNMTLYKGSFWHNCLLICIVISAAVNIKYYCKRIQRVDLARYRE
jgi:hypothetical protein